MATYDELQQYANFFNALSTEDKRKACTTYSREKFAEKFGSKFEPTKPYQYYEYIRAVQGNYNNLRRDNKRSNWKQYNGKYLYMYVRKLSERMSQLMGLRVEANYVNVEKPAETDFHIYGATNRKQIISVQLGDCKPKWKVYDFDGLGDIKLLTHALTSQAWFTSSNPVGLVVKAKPVVTNKLGQVYKASYLERLTREKKSGFVVQLYTSETLAFRQSKDDAISLFNNAISYHFMQLVNGLGE